MARDVEYHEFVMDEILSGISGIHSRPMFGGWGIYKEGVFFALIADGQLYFKADASNKKDFEELGSELFIYEAKGKSISLSYWLLPEEIMTDKQKIAEWVDKSVMASIKSKKKK